MKMQIKDLVSFERSNGELQCAQIVSYDEYSVLVEWKSGDGISQKRVAKNNIVAFAKRSHIKLKEEELKEEESKQGSTFQIFVVFLLFFFGIYASYLYYRVSFKIQRNCV